MPWVRPAEPSRPACQSRCACITEYLRAITVPHTLQRSCVSESRVKPHVVRAITGSLGSFPPYFAFVDGAVVGEAFRRLRRCSQGGQDEREDEA